MSDGFLPREKLDALGLSKSALDKFDAYAKLMLEYNALFNLTAITQPHDIAVKHFADSLCGSKLIPQNASIIDIGSGAGFPGLPLAIARPDITVTLIDGTGKKVRFLEIVIAALALANAKALHTRAEDAGALAANFDIATARAVAPLGELIKYAFPLLKLNGKLIAYKGIADEEIAAATPVLAKYGGKVEEVQSFLLDGQYERSLISVIKTAPTPCATRQKNSKK
ncbi:MAG: 16S rRNA (guanine(527)-N(7))-methyltransferase RsmG [Clostridia bacterium]